jgi:hypothetical protein
MSTATAPAAVERPLPAPGDSSAVRVFLARYGATLLPLLTALVALQLGWQMVTGSTWTAAVTAGWALAVAAWLRCRGWHVGTVLTVTGARLSSWSRWPDRGCRLPGSCCGCR